jgi:hypothetical protein
MCSNRVHKHFKRLICCVGFEVIKLMSMKWSISWDVLLCSQLLAGFLLGVFFYL